MSHFLSLNSKTVTTCLAKGDSPGFGSLLSSSPSELPSPVFGDHLFFPDFFSDRLRTPSIAGYGTDRATPVRGHAALRVVMK